MTRRNAKGHTKKMRKSLAKWVRSQIGATVKRRNTKRRRNVEMGFYSGGVFHPIRASSDYSRTRGGDWRGASKKLKAAISGAKKRAKKFAHNPGTVRHVKGQTGWIKAKSVRIVKSGGRTVVQVKR